jgi:hypothetical protein
VLCTLARLSKRFFMFFVTKNEETQIHNSVFIMIPSQCFMNSWPRPSQQYLIVIFTYGVDKMVKMHKNVGREKGKDMTPTKKKC